MKTFQKFLCPFFGLMLLVSANAQYSAGEEPPPTVVLPALPQRLLQALPETPQGWKLLHSRGRSDLYGTTVPVSFAQRRFEIPRQDEAGNPLPPGRLDLSLMDVGSLTEMTQSLRRRMEVLKEAGSGKEISITSNSEANLSETAGGKVRFQAAVGDRLILHGTFRAMESEEAQAAMELLIFEKIESLNRILPKRSITSWTYPTQEFDELTGHRHESTITIHRPKPLKANLDPPSIPDGPPLPPPEE